jgi:sugar phosphate permease
MGLAEIFSMNIRAQAVGMASQSQNVANAVVQQFFPIFLNNCGFYAFYMFAGINAILGLFVYFCIPETKKVGMEEMDELFGGGNHVEKGGEILHDEDVHRAHYQSGNRASEDAGEISSVGANAGNGIVEPRAEA